MPGIYSLIDCRPCILTRLFYIRLVILFFHYICMKKFQKLEQFGELAKVSFYTHSRGNNVSCVSSLHVYTEY